MKFLRAHWYDIGGGLAIIVLGYFWFSFENLSHFQMIVWLSLISLFIHQLEEYRLVGSFPDMVNRVLFKSEIPDRYTLNSNTTLIVNVVGIVKLIQWLADKNNPYVFAEKNLLAADRL